tara:strand:- start:146 stop:709 length:564 start_codon:yes stop_codon:yes gene_type:complete
MEITKLEIPGVVLIKPDRFEDSRGYFFESYSKRKYQEIGINEDLLQDNVSFSKQHVLRGLHFQSSNVQGKLVYALQGRVFDVAVDIRKGSPTFKKWVSCELSDKNRMQLWVPPGFAHGFCVLSQSALFCYKCSNYYDPESEVSLAWNDPKIGINWPIDNPILSDKDNNLPSIDEIGDDLLPIYEGNS